MPKLSYVPEEWQAGKLKCTNCKVFREPLEFPPKITRGKKIRSRWCGDCVKSYARDYSRLTRVTTPYRSYHRKENKLSLATCRAVAEDTRKGIAIALTYNISLSVVYKIKSAARKLELELQEKGLTT